MSDDCKELYTALSKAQGDIDNAKKNRSAPVGKDGKTRGYADLASVIDAAKEALAENGLSVIQSVATEPIAIEVQKTDQNQQSYTVKVMQWYVRVSTSICHMSGQRIECGTMTIPAAIATAFNNDAQQIGIATTYARRYALMAALGIAAEDADGSQAQQYESKPGQARQQAAATPAEQATNPPNGIITKGQVTSLANEVYKKYGKPAIVEVKTALGIPETTSLADISDQMLPRALKELQAVQAKWAAV